MERELLQLAGSAELLAKLSVGLPVPDELVGDAALGGDGRVPSGPQRGGLLGGLVLALTPLKVCLMKAGELR